MPPGAKRGDGQAARRVDDAAPQATRPLLVGKAWPRGWTRQACLVCTRRLPRFAQLLQAEPHITTRYANRLLRPYNDPDLWAHLHATMPKKEARLPDELGRRSPHRKRLAGLES